MSSRGKRVPRLRFPEFEGDGEWEEKKLGQVLVKNSRKNKEQKYAIVQSVSNKHGFINQDDYFENRRIASKDTSNYYVIDKGYFAYNPSRIDVGSLAYKIDAQTSIISPLYVSFKANQNFISDLFLLNFFSTLCFTKQMIFEGGVRNTLNYENLTQIVIPVPKLNEQEKVAGCLMAIDEVIAVESERLEALKAHKKGLLQRLFPREGERVPRLRFPEFEGDGEWEEKKLGEVCEISSGTTPLRSNPLFYQEGNIFWVKTTDLNNGFIFNTEEKITELSNAKINQEGSILLAMYGGFNQIGRTGYLMMPAATNQAISVLLPSKRVLTSLFLLMWLNASVNKWKIFASSSRKDPNITGNDVAKFPIYLPSKVEQEKVAGCLMAIDEVIAVESERVEALKAHKRGMMQGLFPS